MLMLQPRSMRLSCTELSSRLCTVSVFTRGPHKPPSSQVLTAHAAAEEREAELHRAQQQALYIISSYKWSPQPPSSQVLTAHAAAEEREAELRRAMRDGEARLRERLGQLEADNVALRRWVPPCGVIAGVCLTAGNS